MNNQPERKEKFHLLTWLIIPILGVWLGTNYLLGVTKRPAWEISPSLSKTSSVLSAKDSRDPNEFQWNGSGLITFWFDDAWYSQYAVGFSVLQEENFKAAVAVPTKLVNSNGYMSWDHLIKLAKNGWEITSHTRSHTCLEDKLDDEEVELEIRESRADLEEIGLKSEIFVTACGVENQTIADKTKRYYSGLRRATAGLNILPVENPYQIQAQTLHVGTTLEQVKEWIEETKKSKSWLVLAFHQIDTRGLEYSVHPQMFQEIVNLVKASNLPVVNPSDALKVTNIWY